MPAIRWSFTAVRSQRPVSRVDVRRVERPCSATRRCCRGSTRTTRTTTMNPIFIPVPNHSGIGSVSSSGTQMSVPPTKKQMCSSACAHALWQRRLVEERDVPEREDGRPDDRARRPDGRAGAAGGCTRAAAAGSARSARATIASGARSPMQDVLRHVQRRDDSSAVGVDGRGDARRTAGRSRSRTSRCATRAAPGPARAA